MMPGNIQPASATSLKRYFVGFGTQNSHLNGVRTLYDIDLINQDLANAFNTRVGERVMRPDWGCKLWDYLMEPLTPVLRDEILREAMRICSLDQRLAVQNVQLFQLDNGFRIEITLLYQPWNVVGTFTTSFQQSEATYFSGTSNGF